MSNNEKIDILTKVINKASKDLKSLTQAELGIMTKLSYGATINDFNDTELNKI